MSDMLGNASGKSRRVSGLMIVGLGKVRVAPSDDMGPLELDVDP